MNEDEVLNKYDYDLDPPTMVEFNLGMCLGTLMDIIANFERWRDEDIVRMLNVSSDWMVEFKKKYTEMMETYGGRDTNNRQ